MSADRTWDEELDAFGRDLRPGATEVRLREQLEGLLDPGSLHRIGRLARSGAVAYEAHSSADGDDGLPATDSLAGIAEIGGRRIIVFAEATAGGRSSADEGKLDWCRRMARRQAVPLVHVVESCAPAWSAFGGETFAVHGLGSDLFDAIRSDHPAVRIALLLGPVGDAAAVELLSCDVVVAVGDQPDHADADLVVADVAAAREPLTRFLTLTAPDPIPLQVAAAPADQLIDDPVSWTAANVGVALGTRDGLPVFVLTIGQLDGGATGEIRRWCGVADRLRLPVVLVADEEAQPAGVAALRATLQERTEPTVLVDATGGATSPWQMLCDVVDVVERIPDQWRGPEPRSASVEPQHVMRPPKRI